MTTALENESITTEASQADEHPKPRKAPIGIAEERRLWPVVVSGLLWLASIGFLALIASRL